MGHGTTEGQTREMSERKRGHCLMWDQGAQGGGVGWGAGLTHLAALPRELHGRRGPPDGVADGGGVIDVPPSKSELRNWASESA